MIGLAALVAGDLRAVFDLNPGFRLFDRAETTAR